MAAYTHALLEPLVAHMSELETTVRDQAETIGRLSAQLEASAAEIVEAKTRDTRLTDELTHRRAENADLRNQLAAARTAAPHRPVMTPLWGWQVPRWVLVVMLVVLCMVIAALLFLLASAEWSF
jgi:hypothetical protein